MHRALHQRHQNDTVRRHVSSDVSYRHAAQSADCHHSDDSLAFPANIVACIITENQRNLITAATAYHDSVFSRNRATTMQLSDPSLAAGMELVRPSKLHIKNHCDYYGDFALIRHTEMLHKRVSHHYNVCRIVSCSECNDS